MSSQLPRPSSTSTTASPYPFAAAPDIVRAHQKDAYFTGHLTNAMTDLYRRLFGARSTHALAPELRSLATLLYFCLTTLPGNRTLGEEYCDLVQVESPRGRLPAVSKRAAYIGGTILLPYLVGRTLPRLRNRLRAIIHRRLDALRKRGGGQESRQARALEYVSDHLPSLTSAAPIQAVTLALFYFNGTYYELAKRLLSLRYVLTRAVPDSPDRGGYEVLGVLLVIQLAVQGYLHIRSTLSSSAVDVSLDRANSYSTTTTTTTTTTTNNNNNNNHNNNNNNSNNHLLSAELGTRRGPQQSRVDLASATHTPVSAQPRFDLGDAKLMRYIRGRQQRKCTLCLEELKDPSATQCGHVFCWECIGDWVREKPECPLCRREAMVQHILPLRVM